MWTDEQLNAAKYVVFVNQENQQDMNVGTIEISGTNGGVFLTVPAPPFGGLSNDSNSVSGMKTGATLPLNAVTRQYAPRGRPVPERPQPDQYVIHDYGNLLP